MFVFDTKQTLTHGGVFLVFDDDMSLPSKADFIIQNQS